jgi:hypothetical protein
MYNYLHKTEKMEIICGDNTLSTQRQEIGRKETKIKHIIYP